MNNTRSTIPGVSNALEFHLLSRACADGTPEHLMTRDLPQGREALELLCHAGRLKIVDGGYALTYAGEDRLDALFEAADAHSYESEDLTTRVLRVMRTLAHLDVEQISTLLGAKPSSVSRLVTHLLHEGKLSRHPKPSNGQRGRTAFVYVRAA